MPGRGEATTSANGLAASTHTSDHTENIVGGKKDSSVESFLKSVYDLAVKEGWEKAQDRNELVVKFKSPEELRKVLNIEVEDCPASHSDLLQDLKDVFTYSVKTGNPHFFNQLYAGIDPYGFAGQIVTDVLNTSIYTYEVAPVFVLIEQYLLKQFCEMVGYPDGTGTFPPGGSYCNMLGMNLARFHKFPDIKNKGLFSLPRMVAFASCGSHYSNKKNATLLGLGLDSLISVNTTSNGKMDPVDLEKRVLEAQEQGSVPFLVVATAGTTVLGAYDPLNQIADICEKYEMWMHVDGAWGGGALFSEKHRHLMDGLHRSDSVSLNPHKMLMAPLQCCMFVTKHPNTMKNCHTLHVPYLFQQDKTLYDASYDVGSKVLQCGRKVDAFKFWLMWKAHGRLGLSDRVEKAFENSRFLIDILQKTEGFKLVTDPECTNVCFWYLPKIMRDTDWNLRDEKFCRKLASVAPQIKERMTKKGSMLVGYQPVGNLPNFFRMVVINDKVTREDMEFVVQEIDLLGSDL
ncbi:acidic amino acid decarboxylase GADL1-like isoform X2 [Clavelina lepadiformis]|uniref:Cysteine sulfinic acid decarboxylase n=1 Tax=Clavelina lepadiformis TaxID=159417 RepID=A0ABP0F3F3_CLALP